MLEQSQPRLNRMGFVGYYLDTQVDEWPHQRVKLVEVMKRRVDMDVSGAGSGHGSAPARKPTPVVPKSGASMTSFKRSPDEIDDSLAFQKRTRTTESAEARAARIALIKEAIDDGDYDTDDKLEAALTRMFEIHGFDLGDD